MHYREGMTDTNTTSAPIKAYNIGDELQVSRGKYSGQTGKVIAFAEADEYVLQFADGGAAIVKVASLKAPAEKTITESALQNLIDDNVDIPSAHALVMILREATGMNLRTHDGVNGN